MDRAAVGSLALAPQMAGFAGSVAVPALTLSLPPCLGGFPALKSRCGTAFRLLRRNDCRAVTQRKPSMTGRTPHGRPQPMTVLTRSAVRTGNQQRFI